MTDVKHRFDELCAAGTADPGELDVVYDAMPVFDHFKRVDTDTLMGIMNGKLESAFGVKDLYYFWLERVA